MRHFVEQFSLQDVLDLPGYDKTRAALRAGAATCVLDHVGELIVLYEAEAEKGSPWGEKGEGEEGRINAEVCDQTRGGVQAIVDLLLQTGEIDFRPGVCL